MSRLSPSSRVLAGLVLLSLVFTLFQSGPLNGTTAALIITVAAQVYLPGYLLARWLGKLHSGHPILRFAWVLACGLSLTIVLGSIPRLFNLPVYLYLGLLHALMLGLAVLPVNTTNEEAGTWRLSWRKLPLYVLVMACCLVVVGVSYNSRYRFYGFEDQVIFTSHVSWLANNPGDAPADLPLRSRQASGLEWNDTRFDTDGWTYTHAAWVWTSGVSASQLIWYDLDPLFLWTVPLAAFALAYQLTRREEAAVWAAAGLTIAGLLTLDNLVYNPAYTAFGRFNVFQINTLRQMSITLMLPLALMVGVSYLRSWQRRDLGMSLLAGAALAILHPFQIMLFVMMMGVTTALHLLSHPRRGLLLKLLPLALVIAVLLAIPFIQRLNRSGLGAADTMVREDFIDATDAPTAVGDFLLLPDFPLIGDTLIRNPSTVFYHPVIALVVALGLLYGLRWRHSLAAQTIFGTTALTLILLFTPGLTAFYNRFVSSVGVLTTQFMLPVALALGLSLDIALRWLHDRLRLNFAPLAALVALGAIVLLLFEPVPVPASARDQMLAFNDMQEHRRLRPAHTALIAELAGLIDHTQTSIFMTPEDASNFIIEDLPRTLITGGRASISTDEQGDYRFFNQAGWREPWLDSSDLAYMEQWGATHLTLRPDSTRFPQVVLQPDRFSPIGRSPGYAIFTLASASSPDEVDALYAEMNPLYASLSQPRWGPEEGFQLVRPGAADVWTPIADRWLALLDQTPDDARVRLGLAFSYLMMGADDMALPQWERLHNEHPDVPLFGQALAYTHHILGEPAQGAQVLLDALQSEIPETRVIAARTLLTETFFYLLDDAQLDTVLGIPEADAVAWDYLADFDQPDAIRERVALLMGASRWSTASAWLNRLPQIFISPADLTVQAGMALAQGDIDAALNWLRPATDTSWRAAKEAWQPDRWQSNTAAQMYTLITSDDSLLPLVESGRLYAMQPEIVQDDAANTLAVTATYSNLRPHNTYPIEFWRIEVIAPDASQRYALRDAPAHFDGVAPVREAVSLDLPGNLDPLTPALVMITPGHSNTITTEPLIAPVTLNRPGDADIPDTATTANLRFGEAVTLESYTLETQADTLDLTLYWQADQPLPEDYQIFVHVLDSDGAIIAQADSAPVQNRYPTGHWRSGVTIEDRHTLAVDSLPAGFAVRVGMYRLPDATRLPVTPVDDRVQDNSVLLQAE